MFCESSKVSIVLEKGLNGRYIDILLVEDNPGDARRIELMLESADIAYHLNTAVSLQATFSHLNQNPVQIVLLDLTLPDSSGIETVRNLRAAHPWTPIVVLTGLEDEQIIAEAATQIEYQILPGKLTLLTATGK